MKTSIVVTSRNDGYGGHLEYRATQALNAMIKHYDEVIYVDWNSPDGVSLVSKLSLEKTGKLKHVVVTQNDIERLNPSLLSIPIVEVLGRNIGIRRASGDWIVSSNIDIMPETAFSIILWDSYNKNRLFTCQRRNVPVDIFLRSDFSYKYCIENIDSFRLIPRIDDGYSLVQCCGDYQMAHRDLWYKMRGFEEGMIYRDCADSNLMKKGLVYGDGTDIINLAIFHLDHSGHGETSGVTKKNEWGEWVDNFKETKNNDDWGFPNYSFYEEVI